jgi:hypothetical protein
MKAPKIQRIGKKIPRKHIHPSPFLNVIKPSVNTKTRYRKNPPKPIPHHMIAPLRVVTRSQVAPLPDRCPGIEPPVGRPLYAGAGECDLDAINPMFAYDATR